MAPEQFSPEEKKKLLDKLCKNRITFAELVMLRRHVNTEDLSYAIRKIYDLNDDRIRRISAVEGALKKMNANKNANRNAQFDKTIKNGFRAKEGNKVVLVEGDSWFNYPVILTDVIDWISQQKNIAVSSVASGGDWLLNMLDEREYVEELSLLYPDYFLISGGGNDIVGGRRVAAVVDSGGASDEYVHCALAEYVMGKRHDMPKLDEAKFQLGCKYLSKDFFALLMFFHLQYYFLIRGLLCNGKEEAELAAGEQSKFSGMCIITQGYDFPIPSNKKQFGLNLFKWYVPLVRMFLGHSIWLKKPLEMRGIYSQQTQEAILYAMLYMFNEVVIDIGYIFNNEKGLGKRVLHIDSRGSVGRNGWTDELHPLPAKFRETAKKFIQCINEEGNNRQTTYDHVYVVKP